MLSDFTIMHILREFTIMVLHKHVRELKMHILREFAILVLHKHVRELKMHILREFAILVLHVRELKIYCVKWWTIQSQSVIYQTQTNVLSFFSRHSRQWKLYA